MEFVQNVAVKSAWSSKINWGAVVAALAVIATNFGIDVEPEMEVKIVSVITGLFAAYTWYMRTFKTKSLTKSSS